MGSDGKCFETAGGAIRAWIEQGASVMLRASDSYGDPVELNQHELLELIGELSRLAALLEA